VLGQLITRHIITDINHSDSNTQQIITQTAAVKDKNHKMTEVSAAPDYIIFLQGVTGAQSYVNKLWIAASVIIVSCDYLSPLRQFHTPPVITLLPASSYTLLQDGKVNVVIFLIIIKSREFK